MPVERLVLASASPRRRELLAAAGIVFDVDAVDVDESLLDGESPAAYVERLAHLKARTVLVRHPAAAVLGADTTVVVDGHVLGKPENDAEAADMLRRLSGRAHEVLTGIALLTGTGACAHVECTKVWMTALSALDIQRYVASGEPRDKAGAYAIQGRASRFVTRIEGSYSNVVGLPVSAVVALLRHVAPELVS
jgi:septum formation protein